MRQNILAACPDCGAQVQVTVTIDDVSPHRDLMRDVTAISVTASGSAMHVCTKEV